MPQRWQMRMAGALPVGTDVSSCSWCFVKLGSSVEIARPVVVSEKGDSRVSRKWERLALRGAMVVLCAWALVGGVQCALFALPALRAFVRVEAVEPCPSRGPYDRRRSFRAVEPNVTALQRKYQQHPVYAAAVKCGAKTG